jgi:1,2-dihydroxy-3-keto-5-methylthiopentene dioxygenase
MAYIHVEDGGGQIIEEREVGAFLASYGVGYERWETSGRAEDQSSDVELLAAFAEEIDLLKKRAGFSAADVVQLSPDTDGLEAIMSQFRRLHTHDDDEVRFVVSGSGSFYMSPGSGSPFTVVVGAGDLISVPRGVSHSFDLCSDNSIRCIRLFTDPAGWAAHYVDQSA